MDKVDIQPEMNTHAGTNRSVREDLCTHDMSEDRYDEKKLQMLESPLQWINIQSSEKYIFISRLSGSQCNGSLACMGSMLVMQHVMGGS